MEGRGRAECGMEGSQSNVPNCHSITVISECVCLENVPIVLLSKTYWRSHVYKKVCSRSVVLNLGVKGRN